MMCFSPLINYPQVCYRKEDTLLYTFIILKARSWNTPGPVIKYYSCNRHDDGLYVDQAVSHTYIS
jgi:hypothetical protein